MNSIVGTHTEEQMSTAKEGKKKDTMREETNCNTRCLRKCLDRLPALAPAPPSSVVTSGIFSVTNSTTDAILDIEPSVFMAPVDQDSDEESDPAFADPDFQAYVTNAWAAFQADRKDKWK